MFLETIIISLVIGMILKGSFKNLQKANLAHIELIFIGFLIEIALVLLKRAGIVLDKTAVYIIYLLMYLLLLIFVYLNRKLYQILLMGAGFLFNAIAIFTNGGNMPVSGKAAVAARLGIDINNIAAQGLYKVADSNTNFFFFCDIIPRPFPRPLVISIGDIFIAVGLFLLILKLMGSKIVLSGRDK